jgi:hypothetical protein
MPDQKKKVKAVMYFNNMPTITQEFDYVSEYHLRNYIMMALIMADQHLNIPILVVVEVDGVYYAHGDTGGVYHEEQGCDEEEYNEAPDANFEEFLHRR